jgi:predicted short-subunit dehydrogenase-like oxidoreductase (DUF2520 family)
MSNRRQPHEERPAQESAIAMRARKLPPHARQSSIAIIGAGRLGTALGLALHARGFEITCFVAARRYSAARAVRLIKRHSTGQDEQASLPLALTADELEQIPPGKIYLFATPDDKLREASGALALALQKGSAKIHKSSVALHTSGALSSNELVALRKMGCATGSLHPLVAVTTNAIEGAYNLQNVFYCVEGDARAVRAARVLIRALDGRAFTVDSEKKGLYHAAAVITSGHTVALFDVACEMLSRCGISEQESRRVLLPLLASTLRNLQTHASAQALTGTFARADLATLRLHLAAFQSEHLPFAAQVYRLLGRRAIELARGNGADAVAIKRIEKLLVEDSKKS